MFRSLDGTTLVPLPGSQLAKGLIVGGRTWLGAADGSTWLLDTEARQLVKQHQPLSGRDALHVKSEQGKRRLSARAIRSAFPTHHGKDLLERAAG